MVDIDTDPLRQFSTSGALAINDSGQVVGDFLTGGQFHAFRYLNGTSTALEDLNSLIDPSSGWVLNYATAIDAAGDIAGYGTINNELHAFLLAVPEPANLGAFGGLFLLGLSARSAWRARKRRTT